MRAFRPLRAHIANDEGMAERKLDLIRGIGFRSAPSAASARARHWLILGWCEAPLGWICGRNPGRGPQIPSPL
jgi:hypothetical protein